ncbi:hypothetical protein SPONL_1933 [uncultured Candidatus Thioglobus sp.]|nr:hypothetical protein SPONL_1933 [uncultured Candidatus Thioglobus sp.]
MSTIHRHTGGLEIQTIVREIGLIIHRHTGGLESHAFTIDS